PLFILRGARACSRRISFAHICAALGCAVVSCPSEMINLRVKVHPNDRIAGTPRFCLRLCWELAGARWCRGCCSWGGCCGSGRRGGGGGGWGRAGCCSGGRPRRYEAEAECISKRTLERAKTGARDQGKKSA